MAPSPALVQPWSVLIQVDATDYGGYTALHYAARRGASAAAIKLLINKGANPNLAALSGETPADVAISSEAKEARRPAEYGSGLA